MKEKQKEIENIQKNDAIVLIESSFKSYSKIQVSSFCEFNCNFCKYREANLFIERKRFSAEEIIESAINLGKKGCSALILKSCQDSYYDTDMLSYIIYTIKQHTELELILSFGDRGFDEYKTWKIAGADGYILKFETSNETIFKTLMPEKKLENRIQSLKYLKRIGYKTGTGNLLGLPFQTNEDLINDINKILELDVDFIVPGIFVPVPFTPFQKYAKASSEIVYSFLRDFLEYKKIEIIIPRNIL